MQKKGILSVMKFMNWFPGGSLIIPMLLTASINTFFPNALGIGGTTTPLFKTSTLMIIGFILFCSGAAINPKSLIKLFKQNGVYFVMKIGIMFVIAYLAQFVLPPVLAFGIPTVAFYAIMTSTNPGTFLEQVTRYGTDIDKASFPLVHLSTTVAVPVFVYGLVGAASGNFDGMAMFALFVPFFVGFILGNLDPDFAAFFKPGTAIMIPILGANFGASMNLKSAVMIGGIPGIIISLVYAVVIIGIFLFVDKVILRRPGYLSVAWCSVSGSCAAIPPLIIATSPALKPYEAQSIAMVAMATILTNFIMPIVNKKVVAKWGDARGDKHLSIENATKGKV